MNGAVFENNLELEAGHGIADVFYKGHWLLFCIQ
jgi:hypothetical protein